jgi:hypothetical protein
VGFRDTAHGFLAWALATVLSAALLGAAVTSVVRGGASAITEVAAGAAHGASEGAAANTNGSGVATDYFVDVLFRPAGGASTAAPAANGAEMKAEASRILAASLARGQVLPADKTQLGHLIAARTGMSDVDAEARLSDVLGQIESAKREVKAAADAARKAGITLSLMTFLSLLIGAFIASAAAALGGKHRDED